MINSSEGYRDKFKRDFAEIWLDLFKVCGKDEQGTKLVFTQMDFIAKLESVHSFLHILFCPLFRSDYTSQGGGHISYIGNSPTYRGFEDRLQYIEDHLKKGKTEDE